MMKRTILFACSLWLSIVAMIAADNKCSGIVVDEANEPLIGATVSVPGTSIGVPTDIDGHFTIQVPAGKKIRVYYIG